MHRCDQLDPGFFRFGFSAPSLKSCVHGSAIAILVGLFRQCRITASGSPSPVSANSALRTVIFSCHRPGLFSEQRDIGILYVFGSC
jgi:hypothetical protein